MIDILKETSINEGTARLQIVVNRVDYIIPPMRYTVREFNPFTNDLYSTSTFPNLKKAMAHYNQMNCIN